MPRVVPGSNYMRDLSLLTPGGRRMLEALEALIEKSTVVEILKSPRYFGNLMTIEAGGHQLMISVSLETEGGTDFVLIHAMHDRMLAPDE